MSIISYDQTHSLSNPHNRTNDDVQTIFELCLVKHGKNYNALEERKKQFQTFKDNLKFVDEHNVEKSMYKVGLSRFAHLTNEEFPLIFFSEQMKRRSLRVSSTRSDRYLFWANDELSEVVD